MTTGNSRYLKIGPGGRNCPCCFPAKGSKDRRSQFRRAKKKSDRLAMREAEDELNAEYEFLRELQSDLEYYYEEDMSDDWDYIEYEELMQTFDDPYDYLDDECWHCGRMSIFCQCDGN